MLLKMLLITFKVDYNELRLIKKSETSNTISLAFDIFKILIQMFIRRKQRVDTTF